MSEMISLTNVIFILDRSGSMCGLEDETIGGFNSLIEKQKNSGEITYVSLVLFDNVVENVYSNLDIRKVPKLTRDVYYTRGSTSLLDAIGMTINNISNQYNEISKNNIIPSRTLMIITTDGMENSSTEYNYKKLKN